MLFVGHTSMSVVIQDVGFAVAADRHVPPGCCSCCSWGRGRGHVGQGDGDRAAEQQLQRFAGGGGIAARPSPLAWLRRGSERGGFLGLAGQCLPGSFPRSLCRSRVCGSAGLVAGDVLPCREVVAVRSVTRSGEMARIRSPSWSPATGHEVEQQGPSGERAVDELFLPGRPGPQRGLIEPDDLRGDNQRLDQLRVPAAIDAALARQEWMNPADTSAPATSDSSSRHRSTGTCWKTSR